MSTTGRVHHQPGFEVCKEDCGYTENLAHTSYPVAVAAKVLMLLTVSATGFTASSKIGYNRHACPYY